MTVQGDMFVAHVPYSIHTAGLAHALSLQDEGFKTSCIHLCASQLILPGRVAPLET